MATLLLSAGRGALVCLVLQLCSSAVHGSTPGLLLSRLRMEVKASTRRSALLGKVATCKRSSYSAEGTTLCCWLCRSTEQPPG